MGMFNYVNFEMDCPNCGKKLNGWQSKSGLCTMTTLDPVSVNTFYDWCECGTWIEFSRPKTHKDQEVRKTPYTKSEVEDIGFVMEVKSCHP